MDYKALFLLIVQNAPTLFNLVEQIAEELKKTESGIAKLEAVAKIFEGFKAESGAVYKVNN